MLTPLERRCVTKYSFVECKTRKENSIMVASKCSVKNSTVLIHIQYTIPYAVKGINICDTTIPGPEVIKLLSLQ